VHDIGPLGRLYAVGLQGIGNIAEILAEGFRIFKLGNFLRGNGLADPDLYVRSPLIEKLMDEPGGSETGMDTAQ